MTETEYFSDTKKYLEEIIRNNVKNESVLTESAYMDMGIRHLKRIYIGERGRRGTFVWRPQELKELNDIWTSIRPDLEKAISDALHRYMKRKMVTEINAISGEALVKAAMAEAGLSYIYTAQMYRAKIEVKISARNALTFYLSYKKIGEELPKAISAAKSMSEIMETLGSGAFVRKIYSCEPW